MDFNRDSNLDIPYGYKDRRINKEPQITIDRNFNPFKSDQQEPNSFPFKRKKTRDWESLYVDVKAPNIDIKNIEVQSEIIDAKLFKNEQTIAKTYQVHKKYIISSIKSGMIFINQNLAHQRILYEEFLESITVKEAMSQQLLFPLNIHFNKDDITMIKEIQNDLESTGFMFDKIENETVIVKGIPTTINESQVTIIIEQLLEDIKNEIPENSFSQLDIMAKSLAKSLAIKNGTRLTVTEQETIVEGLFSCKEPNHSPFGKPTHISMDIEEIDKKFDL